MHLRLGIYAAALVSLAPLTARAIIVGDAPSGLTTAPVDGGGFPFVGQWGNGVGSGVAIAPRWLITAQHFNNASNQFILNGVTYTRDQPLVDIPGTDLRLVHVDGTFPSYAPLYRKSDGSEVGKNASLVGFGFRQHAVNPDVVTGSIQNGWFWAGDAVTRSRGRNLVSGLKMLSGLPVMYYDFDASTAPSAVAEEASLAEHDSGGGAFVFDDGEWKLAGVHLSLDVYYRNITDTDFLHASIFENSGLFRGTMPKTPAPGGPGNSYSSRVAPFLAQIDSATSFSAASTRYWDINGSTAGAGGATPGGNWNGTTVQFNTDATGGGAGALDAAPASVDTVVFAAGGDASGVYTVNVSGTRPAGSVQFTEGDVTLTGGTLATGAIDVSSGASGTITSTLAAPSSSVSMSGSGLLRLTKLPQNHAVTISAGMVRVLESSPSLSNGHPSGNNASVSRVSSLSISPGATLDLANNDLIVDYTGASPAAALEDLIRSAFTAGDWLGTGITSSIAALDNNYVLAIADNASLASPFGSAQGGPMFSGVDVDLTSVLVKFTHRVDLDLDGLITANDAAIFGTNFSENAPATWAMGDMNYDGLFTPEDAAIFGTFYDDSVVSLPEPSTLALFALAGVAGLRRGTRRR